MTMGEIENYKNLESTQELQDSQQQDKEKQQTQKRIFKKQNLSSNDQNTKERTLFCINIDQRCTEDILFELFLQAGPIENIIRKPDRNGNIICLITYKHIESVDYAIQLFDKILLYGQKLKVQLSQANIKPSTDSTNTPPPPALPSSSSSLTTSTTSPNIASGYQKPYSRTQSYDNMVNIRQQQQQQQTTVGLPPLLAPQLMPFNLLQLMAQPLMQYNDLNNSPQQNNHRNYNTNQSPSPNNHNHHHHHHNNNNNNYHNSRHDHSRNSNYHHNSRSRDNSRHYHSDRRSRSPHSNNRRR